jgi:hypothetical protein
MNDITKAMHLDALRITSEGAWVMPLYAVVSPLLTLLYGELLGKEGEYWMLGIIKLLIVMLTIYVVIVIFYYENQNGHYRINAILPVSRPSLVEARYMFVLVVDAMGMIDFAICILLLVSVTGSGLPMRDVLMNGAATLGIIIASQAVLLPIMYRFSSMQIIAVLIFALFLLEIGTYVLGFVFENQIAAITAWLTTHIFVSMPLTVLFAAVLLVAAVAASLSISIRIYHRKEL